MDQGFAIIVKVSSREKIHLFWNMHLLNDKIELVQDFLLQKISVKNVISAEVHRLECIDSSILVNSIGCTCLQKREERCCLLSFWVIIFFRVYPCDVLYLTSSAYSKRTTALVKNLKHIFLIRQKWMWSFTESSLFLKHISILLSLKN